MLWKLDGNYSLGYFLLSLDKVDQEYMIRLLRYDQVQFVTDFLLTRSALE